MHYRKFILNGENLQDRVSDFVRLYYQEAYESEYPGGFLRVYEDYSFVNSNEIMICIRVDTTEVENGTMKIEIIAGGGSGGMLIKGTWWSERRRVKHFQNELEDFCKAHEVNFDIENP